MTWLVDSMVVIVSPPFRRNQLKTPSPGRRFKTFLDRISGTGDRERYGAFTVRLFPVLLDRDSLLELLSEQAHAQPDETALLDPEHGRVTGTARLRPLS
jgi:hypothetical protein